LVVYSYAPHFCIRENWRFARFAENLLWCWKSTVKIPQSFNYIMIKICVVHVTVLSSNAC
jgi:hypothetical protein